MTYLPSISLKSYEIIRIYENKKCEIPLLFCPSSPIRAPQTSMLCMQKDMVNPKEKTRTTQCQMYSKCVKASLSRKVFPSSACQASAWNETFKFSPSISSNIKSICCSSLCPTNSFWKTNFVSRWPLVHLSKQTLGSLFNRFKISIRQKGYFSRSNFTCRSRRSSALAQSFCCNPCGTTVTNRCLSRRQPSRNEAYCKTRKLDTSTVPFSFTSETSRNKKTYQIFTQRRKYSRRNLSIDSPGNRNSGRITFKRCTRTLNPDKQVFLWNPANPSNGQRMHSICQILPRISNLSWFEFTKHNQYYGVNVLYYSRSPAKKPLCLKPKGIITMGNGTYPFTKGASL